MPLSSRPVPAARDRDGELEAGAAEADAAEPDAGENDGADAERVDGLLLADRPNEKGREPLCFGGLEVDTKPDPLCGAVKLFPIFSMSPIGFPLPTAALAGAGLLSAGLGDAVVELVGENENGFEAG